MQRPPFGSDNYLDAIYVLETGTCQIADPQSFAHQPELLTKPRDVDSAIIERFKGLLLDRHSWLCVAKRCLPPRPDVFFRMRGPNSIVLVTLSFNCSDWKIRVGATQCRGFFNPVRRKLMQLVKSIYPEYASEKPDSLWRADVIQQLKRQAAITTGDE